MKNCVKLPSADAESEIPGVEKPFMRDGVAAEGEASATVRTDGSTGGAAAFTKIRVNSPGPGPAPETDPGLGGLAGAVEAGAGCTGGTGMEGGA